jgi:GNAT superfamily N-acetyltransferase
VDDLWIIHFGYHTISIRSGIVSSPSDHDNGKALIASGSYVQHNIDVKATGDGVTIRRATLADLPLLLQYRRAMAEEMDAADEAAVNRMLVALEPYLRAAIPDGRWHAWIAEPGGCGSVEIVPWVPGRQDPTPRRAWIHSLYIEPSCRRRGIARRLTQTIIAWCRERGFQWLYLHASEQGRPLYESLGFAPASEMRLRL